MTKPAGPHLLRCLALLPLLGFLPGCGVGEAGVTAAAPPPTPAAIPVVTARPVRGEATATHSGTVNLEADAEAGVVAKVGGEITELLVEEGDFVEAGQVLARLDRDRLRLRMEQARAALNKLSQEYRRNVELHERGLVSEGAFAEMRYEVEALDAAYRLARLELAYADIVAPIDGVVAAREARVGNTVSAGDVVFRVADPQDLIAYLHVPQGDLAYYAPGMAARLALDALPGHDYSATITRISPRIDPVTGTFRVTLSVDSQGGELRPGMFARVEVVYAQRNDALLVPAAAVLAEDGDSAVYVVEDGVARRRTVDLGFSGPDEIEVVTGLAADETVIVVGQTAVQDGTPVVEATGDGKRI
jgi:membrane fusion protein (multidrug efflux system)